MSLIMGINSIPLPDNLIHYLESGGDVEVKSFSINDLKKMTDKGSKVILTVNLPHLYGKKKVDKTNTYNPIKGVIEEGHFIILDGYKDDNFKILDPYPSSIENREGEYNIDQQIVFNSCLLASGIIIEIYS
ncbi:MAG: hypothetical protein Q9M91_01345 [Candidatus Dojkabacteria bacterium]|nr:hypothetical protein [Candidatus Dojkabacteria bacterium]MDQ7020469.1 hypothetical protein [Candidatus Dojkabacteria bacterium]